MPTLNRDWCEAFAWLDGRITAETTQSVFASSSGTTYCKICDAHLNISGAVPRERHAKQHVKEFEAWKAAKATETRKASTKRLREVAKLKSEGVETVKEVPAVTAREQGVPEVYLKENGAFKPGLDARLKSDLTSAALGLENPAALHSFKPAEARALLAARDWTGYLIRKQETLAKQAAREAAKQKVKA